MNIEFNLGSIIMAVFTILIGSLTYLSRLRISRIENKQDASDKEIKEIVTNYKDRFDNVKEKIDEVKTNLNDNHLIVLERIHSFGDKFATKEYVNLVMHQKEGL